MLRVQQAGLRRERACLCILNSGNSNRKEKSMGVSRQKRVEKAQMKVLFTVPFFAPGVAKLPVEFDPGVPTACTDGQNIRWNPEWFDKLSDPELVTVLCHEVAHCLLGHVWRAPGGADWEVWNEATDHAVNLMLTEFSELVMAKRLADPFPFPQPADAYCANPAFKGKAEEVIYNLLAQGKRGGNGSSPAGGCGASQASGAQPAGKGRKPPGGGKAPQPGPFPGSMPSFGQIAKPPGGAADPAQKKLGNDWENTLVQCAQMSKGRGDLPAGMERFVDSVVNPEVPWWERLAAWLREQASDDWNWMKPNQYFDESEFILPSLDSEKIGAVVFATDTSGSIDRDVLAHFQSEKQACLDDLRPRKLVDICCDSAIHSVKEYQLGDTIDKRAPGGGGTDFRPVFAHVAKMDMPPKCLVYLTDLDGSFPDKDPGFPVLWVVYGGGEGKAPFGEVCKVAS